MDSELEKYIHQLIPLKDLAQGDRVKLIKTGELIKKSMGETLYSNECKDNIFYLISGKLDLCEQYQQVHLLVSQTTDALKSCVLWKLDRKLLSVH